MNRQSQISEAIENHNSMNRKTQPFSEKTGNPALKQLVIKLSTGQTFVSEPVGSEIGKVTVDVEVVNYDENVLLPKVLPKTWNELEFISGDVIDENSFIDHCDKIKAHDSNQNVFASNTQAQSALAYAQLTQLMKAYNGDWVPDWNDVSQDKYVIDRVQNHCETNFHYTSFFCFLAFKTEELRDEFLKNFEPLIKTFYQI